MGMPASRYTQRHGGGMGSVNNLRKQHRELIQLARELTPLLHAERLGHNCTSIRLRLSAFVRKLQVHMALEERFVYGRFLQHPDEAVVAMMMRHHHQTRLLGTFVTHYAQQWTLSTDEAIEKGSMAFVEQTKSLFDQVWKRFHLEDEELYPLLGQIHPTSSGAWQLDSTIESKEKDGAG